MKNTIFFRISPEIWEKFGITIPNNTGNYISKQVSTKITYRQKIEGGKHTKVLHESFVICALI